MTLGILVNVGLGDGLSPGRYQAITGSNVGLFLLEHLQQTISLKFESKYNDYLKINLKCRLKKDSVMLFSAVDWI